MTNCMILMAAELETVKDSFQEVGDGTAHAQVQPRKLGYPVSLCKSNPQSPGSSHSYHFLVVFRVV